MACVLADPVHANGGCIFADPSEIVVDTGQVQYGGGRSYEFPHIHDDEIVMLAVIEKFMEVTNGEP